MFANPIHHTMRRFIVSASSMVAHMAHLLLHLSPTESSMIRKKVAIAVTMLGFAGGGQLQAGLDFTCTEGNGEVTCASPGGALDLAGLGSPVVLSTRGGAIRPSSTNLFIGSQTFRTFTRFEATTLLPGSSTSFGPSSEDVIAIAGTGEPFGLSFRRVTVPDDYASNDLIGALSSTFTGDFASMGITEGAYEWKWGSSANQSISMTTVSGPTSLPGDYNTDGTVNIADLDLMYANWTASGGIFDADGNGTVEANDIGAWLAQASDPANPYLGGAKIFVLGDVELDGDVDSTDLGHLLNHFSDTSGLLFGAGNLNDDANVDSDDLGFLLNNFAFTSSVAAAAVPEPTGWALVFLATAGMLKYRPQRGRAIEPGLKNRHPA